jgi:DNA polymerase-3 subunit gamma/tau
MSYQVLARKWRPRLFQELVGQEHVVRALVNALDSGRLHHALLFTGTRGVGKTTIARIFAKSLNCQEGVTSTPCGICPACREIDEGRFMDLLEVDAASRTKVEDTRDLLENVQYAPSRGRYKVYLIDEVHMLSGHSFNALLKTLEEPPPHVKFLLATTDPQRLPATILSRCLRFNLKRLPTAEIVQYLDAILGQEGIAREIPALTLIARAGNGSMRDALSILDQAIAFGGGQICLADVGDMLGTVDPQHVIELLACLAAGDAAAALRTVQLLDQTAPDYASVLADLLTLLQRIAVIQSVHDTIDDDSADSHAEALCHLAATIAPEDIQLFYQIALIGRRDLPLSPEPKSGFEMILLRMLCFRPLGKEENAFQVDMPISAVSLQRGGVNSSEPAAATPAAPATVLPTSAPAPCDTATNWGTIVSRLGLNGMAQQLALHCVLQNDEDNILHLLLDPNYAQVHTKNGEERLRTALEAYYGKPLQLRIQVSESTVITPACQQSQRQSERQQAAVEAIHSDANVQGLCDTFNARINTDSITPTD